MNTSKQFVISTQRLGKSYEEVEALQSPGVLSKAQISLRKRFFI